MTLSMNTRGQLRHLPNRKLLLLSSINFTSKPISTHSLSFSPSLLASSPSFLPFFSLCLLDSLNQFPLSLLNHIILSLYCSTHARTRVTLQMGSCVSSSHNNKSSSASDSAVKLAALISQPETTSPPATINGNSMIDSGRRDSSGNKEEMMFFESRGWLDSDCEDDFMSVDGEFTPSRGSTPVHHKFCDQTSEAEEKKHEEEPSPTDNKKRLLELFKETQDDEDENEEEDEVAEGKARACLWLRTPVRSSAPATPYNNDRERQQQLKRVRSAAHGSCVPRLVSCSSFAERRRKMMSHAPIHVQR